MYSSPRWQWLISAARLLCVPVGMNSAASLPSSAATRSCSALTLGSSPNTSSPSGAANIASRIAAVGRVTVSLRRSIIASPRSQEESRAVRRAAPRRPALPSGEWTMHSSDEGLS
jgi:hypothetical protein